MSASTPMLRAARTNHASTIFERAALYSLKGASARRRHVTLPENQTRCARARTHTQRAWLVSREQVWPAFAWHLVWTEGVQTMAGPAHVRGASVPHAILAHVGGLVEDEVALPTEVHVGFLSWRRHRPQVHARPRKSAFDPGDEIRPIPTCHERPFFYIPRGPLTANFFAYLFEVVNQKKVGIPKFLP